MIDPKTKITEQTLFGPRRQRRAAPTEHDLQAACFRWFSIQHPQHAGLLFAIPNGGHRDIRTAARLKAEGVVPGIPDLFLAIPKTIPTTFGTDADIIQTTLPMRYHGLFIELKNGTTNNLSDNQRIQIERLEAKGYLCAVCRTFDAFRALITAYLNGTPLPGTPSPTSK